MKDDEDDDDDDDDDENDPDYKPDVSWFLHINTLQYDSICSDHQGNRKLYWSDRISLSFISVETSGPF